MDTIAKIIGRAATALAAFWRGQVELQERQAILNRPWLHDQLHWSTDAAGQRQLHGSALPARPGDTPVSGSGWCPCRPVAGSWPGPDLRELANR